MDDLETLLYEEKDGVAIVTLNRPEVHNAFDQAMRDELQGALDAACVEMTTYGRW